MHFHSVNELFIGIDQRMSFNRTLSVVIRIFLHSSGYSSTCRTLSSLNQPAGFKKALLLAFMEWIISHFILSNFLPLTQHFETHKRSPSGLKSDPITYISLQLTF